PPTRTDLRYPNTAVSLAAHARAAGRHAAQTITWREGSKGTMSSQFVFLRVRPAGQRVARDTRRHPARAVADRPTARRPARAGQVLAVQPARRHRPRRPHPLRQDPLADRTRLPRTENRSGPGPLRGPLLARLAPPHHPRHRRAPVHHHAATRPKSGCAGLTLYKVIRELQTLLATWTGACPTCHQPVKPLPRSNHRKTSHSTTSPIISIRPVHRPFCTLIIRCRVRG